MYHSADGVRVREILLYHFYTFPISGDYNGHFQEAWMWDNVSDWKQLLKKRTWKALGDGNPFYFDVHAGNAIQIRGEETDKQKRAFSGQGLMIKLRRI